MATKLYVGNLPWSVTSEDLQEVFSAQGNVVSATVIRDRDTGRSRGFGFVEMSTPEEAESALEALTEHEMAGRNLKVALAKERAPR